MIRTHTYARRGFSLLELSVVLGIISLIAGVGMTMATGALKAADRVTTQERLNTIKLALDSHLKTYGYLPCPADRKLVPSSTNFGVEDRNNYVNPGTTCTAVGGGGIVSIGGNTAIGGVPVRTLGLPDSYAGDAWGNKLSYAVATPLAADPTRGTIRLGALVVKTGTVSTNTTLTSMRASIPSAIPPVGPESYGTASNDGSGLLMLTFGAMFSSPLPGQIVNVKSTSYNLSASLVSKTATTLVLNTPFTVADTNVAVVDFQTPGNAAAYVVVSHGPDGRGAFPMSGTAPVAVPALKLCNTGAAGSNTSPPPCTDGTMSGAGFCIDIQNCNDTDAQFFDAAYNDGSTPATYFDDYIVWGSNANLRTATNTAQYSACPTGVCESWCAKCTMNFPGALAGPTPVSTNTASDLVLCKKVVTTNADKCEAYCFWSVTTANGYQKCP